MQDYLNIHNNKKTIKNVYNLYYIKFFYKKYGKVIKKNEKF